MRNSWAVEEDKIVCEFYLNHLDTWKNHIDTLMFDLKEAGYGARERTAIIMRIQNYAYLHTGHGLSNASNQSRTIYKLVVNGKM